jgi:replication fork protection complex subunit Tof1/Swi1
MNDAQRSAKKTDELQDLLNRESTLKKEDSKNAPTRHGRFGTMIWVKRDDEKVSTVSGQDVLKDHRTTLLKMDKTKKWNKPTRWRGELQNSTNSFDTPTPLTPSATIHLRTFVEEFLDSGFNPLFTHLRKAIEREADRVSDLTSRQVFFVISWFLEAERHRRSRQKDARKQSRDGSREIEPDSFGLVASVLNQETFILLNRYMQHSYDYKDWQDVDASMRCFTQILLTIQEMAQSPLEEDQEIAENIQNRIFYEETTHDRILSILRSYNDQGFSYLNSCTELSHVFLRMLEGYSKENVDMQVRSRRRIRHKKDVESRGALRNIGEEHDNDSDADDFTSAENISVDRSFNFKRFSAKFCTQRVVNTFVAFTEHYRELNVEQLKRAHRFFYRVAFKQEMSVLLFRVDVISLFYKMIKGPEGLESTNPMYREWEELTRQIIRRLVKKLDQRPQLITEMLFSKINSTIYYLEYGREKQTLTSGSKPPAELEVNPDAATTTEEKLSVVVAALILDEKKALVRWLSQTLASAADERRSWELQAEARQSTSGEVLPTTPNGRSIGMSKI